MPFDRSHSLLVFHRNSVYL